MEANALAGADTIQFAASTDGTPIKLTLHGAGEDAAATGDLDVTEDLTITGNGEANTIIDGDAADRVFEVVNNTTTLNLNQLTVQNGAGVANGGGIDDYGTLNLSSVAVTDNHSTGHGGGIFVESGASFGADGTTIDGNGVTATGHSASGGGLELYASNIVSIIHSMISNNSAVSTGISYAEGGGVDSSSPLELQDCIVRGNTAHSDQGNADGGGVFNEGGGSASLTLSRVEVSGNAAEAPNGQAYGGAISSGAAVTLINTTIADNQGANVGGIYQGNGLLQMVNVTVSGNSGRIGGLFLYGTFSGSPATASTTVKLADTIIAGNTGNAGTADCDGISSGVLWESYGYNLIGDNSQCYFSPLPSDHFGTTASPIDPKLGTLTTAGGNSTQVMPPLAGSPAIDAGDPKMQSGGGTCTTPDQVGNARPVDGDGNGNAVCDIGAYEYQPEAAAGAATPVPTLSDWGLGVLITVLGIVGLALSRRRSVPTA